MSTETTHSKASIVPSSTPGQPITNSLRLYIGLWFPFGINNVVFLGEQLHEHALRLKANPWGSFSGCDYPARMGNEISWKFWLSVHSKGTNYHIEVLLIWNGNGYLHCEADIKNQQNGSLIEDPSSDLVKGIYKELTAYIVNTLTHCLLPHQENYARQVLFGQGLSSALNNFDPDSLHVDAEIRFKIESMRLGSDSIKTSNEE